MPSSSGHLAASLVLSLLRTVTVRGDLGSASFVGSSVSGIGSVDVRL